MEWCEGLFSIKGSPHSSMLKYVWNGNNVGTKRGGWRHCCPASMMSWTCLCAWEFKGAFRICVWCLARVTFCMNKCPYLPFHTQVTCPFLESISVWIPCTKTQKGIETWCPISVTVPTDLDPGASLHSKRTFQWFVSHFWVAELQNYGKHWKTTMGSLGFCPAPTRASPVGGSIRNPPMSRIFFTTDTETRLGAPFSVGGASNSLGVAAEERVLRSSRCLKVRRELQEGPLKMSFSNARKALSSSWRPVALHPYLELIPWDQCTSSPWRSDKELEDLWEMGEIKSCVLWNLLVFCQFNILWAPAKLSSLPICHHIWWLDPPWTRPCTGWYHYTFQTFDLSWLVYIHDSWIFMIPCSLAPRSCFNVATALSTCTSAKPQKNGSEGREPQSVVSLLRSHAFVATSCIPPATLDIFPVASHCVVFLNDSLQGFHRVLSKDISLLDNAGLRSYVFHLSCSLQISRLSSLESEASQGKKRKVNKLGSWAFSMTAAGLDKGSTWASLLATGWTCWTCWTSWTWQGVNGLKDSMQSTACKP